MGIIFLLGGIACYMASRETDTKPSALEDTTSEVQVYDGRRGSKHRNPDEDYHLVDPYLNFGASVVSLETFRKGVARIADDSELMSIVREEYGRPLQDIVRSNAPTSYVARQFLSVLDMDVDGDEGGLTKEEAAEIRQTFRDSDGSLTKEQRHLLDRYGCTYEHGGNNHWHIKYGGAIVVHSSTPSDWRAGRNFASELIRVLGRAKKKRVNEESE